jgi:hypothetical protein
MNLTNTGRLNFQIQIHGFLSPYLQQQQKTDKKGAGS